MSNFLPSKLVSALKRDFHIDEEEFLRTHEQHEQITSVRINPAKKTDLFNGKQAVPWCPTGYYLEERPIFTLDPLFHAGTYYVQEASSMFIDHILRTLGLHDNALLALDLCAAPGGKSTLLNSALHPESLLVSNEIIKSRVTTLVDNLTKWGNLNVVVTNNDPAAFNRLPGFFDLMLVDAPCSGSGMFRKDEQTINEWSEEMVTLCSQRQQRILSDSLSTLKEDGILIYSTCSYSIEENEQIVDWLVTHHGMEPLAIPFDSSWGITETISPKHHGEGYRFYPNKVKGEGFYVACFRKKESQQTFNKKKIKAEKALFDKAILKDWLSPHTEITTLPFKDDTLIIPASQELNIKALQNVLYLKKAGTNMGKLTKKELIPHHELALSNVISDQVDRIELPLDMARQYLRKAEIQPSASVKGWALAQYNGYALGWIKMLPNRTNNYYPKEWRIVNL
ncbi:RNA methyltransferase [Olivibacter sp. XZL3]|uniref:methyltransferase RsmF C-terminal domain-like protein n=1 Tax=Olivibacter sp. XZL3 TaxID=1735116 RepID=UPI0010649765|nr:RNA methyltransferase [Olivibacter sp. XZL3]